MEHHLAIESFSCSWLINLQPNSFDYCASRDEEEDIFGPPEHGSFDHGNLYYYDNQEECFIEMDPKSKKWRGDSKNAAPTQDFNFHVSADASFVDADQIFADGLLVPLQYNHHHHRAIAAATNSSARMRTGGAISSLEYYCCSPVFSETTTPHSPLSPSTSTISSPSSSSSPSSTASLLSSTTSRTPPQAAFLPRCRRYSRRIFGFLSPFCWSWLVKMRRTRRRRDRRGILNMASSPSRMSTSSSYSSSSSATKWGERHRMLGMASDVERSISEAVLHCKRSNGELEL